MRDLVISFGRMDKAAITNVVRQPWSDFATWLTTGTPVTPDKTSQGWYIPAEFSPVYRDSENYVSRHAITFDFDHVDGSVWGIVLNAWCDTAFAMYTTHSHRADRPRFRVVMPLNRPAGFDEFQAVARRVATDVGIELVARESFVPAQMMYCPAKHADAPFDSHVNNGAWLDVDAVLAEYTDWTDVSSWPRRRDGDTVHSSADERVDPREKPGIIGEFNRAFTISKAIERFELPYRRVR